MKCRTCERTAPHRLWCHPEHTARIHMTVPVCSFTCLELWKELRPMVDPNEHELAAMHAASLAGGEYLESLKKSDLSLMTEAQWLSFIEAVCGGYVDELVRRQADAMAALSKVQMQALP